MKSKQIVITCPVTGKELSTGMAMDRKTFEASRLSQNQVQCPHCRQMHIWDKKDSRLRED